MLGTARCARLSASSGKVPVSTGTATPGCSGFFVFVKTELKC